MEKVMSKTITTAIIIDILKDAAAGWGKHSEELRQLDSITGDGDLGVTVELASKAMTDYLDNPGEEDIGKLIMKCGMQINKSSPSTFGTLLASAFMDAGKTIVGRNEIEVKDLAFVGQGAIDGVKKRGKAEIGDKTMLDALVPAVEAYKQAIANNTDYKVAIGQTTEAAKKGMEATKSMKAKYSRASYRPDGGIGIQDAGATATYYLIEAFARSLIKRT
jgi:dihydroxyacetone kinase-like protein